MPAKAAPHAVSVWVLIDRLESVLDAPDVACFGGSRVRYVTLREAVGKLASHPCFSQLNLAISKDPEPSENALKRASKILLRAAQAIPSTVGFEGGQAVQINVQSAVGLMLMLAVAAGRIATYNMLTSTTKHKRFFDLLADEAGVTADALSLSKSIDKVSPSQLIFLTLVCQVIFNEEDDEFCLDSAARCEAQLLVIAHRIFSLRTNSKPEAVLPAWVTGLALPHLLLTTTSSSPKAATGAAMRTASTGSDDSPPPTRRHEVPDRHPFKRPSIDLTATLKDSEIADEIGSPVAKRDNLVEIKEVGRKAGQMFAAIDVKSLLSMKKELRSLSTAHQRANSASRGRSVDSATVRSNLGDSTATAGRVRQLAAKFESFAVGADSDDGRPSTVQSLLTTNRKSNRIHASSDPLQRSGGSIFWGFFGRLGLGAQKSKGDTRVLNSTCQWKDDIGGILALEEDGVVSALSKLLSSFYFIQGALIASAQQSMRREPAGQPNVNKALGALARMLQGSICGMLQDIMALRIFSRNPIPGHTDLNRAVDAALMRGTDIDVRQLIQHVFKEMGAFSPTATYEADLVSNLTKEAPVSRHFVSLSFTLYSMMGSILTTSHTRRIRNALKLLRQHGRARTTTNRLATHSAAVLDRALFTTFKKPGHIVAFALMLDRPHIAYPTATEDSASPGSARHALPADAQDDFLLLWASVMGAVIMPLVGYRQKTRDGYAAKASTPSKASHDATATDSAVERSKFLWGALDADRSAAQVIATVETLLTSLSSYLVAGAVGGAASGTPLASVVQAAVHCFPLVVEALDITFALKEEEEERYELLRLLHGRVQRYDFGSMSTRVYQEAALSPMESDSHEWTTKLEGQVVSRLRAWALLERSLRKACKEALVISRGTCVNVIHHCLEVTDVVFSLVNNHHLVTSAPSSKAYGSVSSLLAAARLSTSGSLSGDDRPQTTVLEHLHALLSYVFLAHQNNAVGTAITHYTRELLISVRDEESDSVVATFPGIAPRYMGDDASVDVGRSMRSSSANTSHYDLAPSPLSPHSEGSAPKSAGSFSGGLPSASERHPRTRPLSAGSIALSSPLDFLEHFDSDSDVDQKDDEDGHHAAGNESRDRCHKRPRAFSVSSMPDYDDDHEVVDRAPSAGAESNGTAAAVDRDRSVSAAREAQEVDFMAARVHKYHRMEKKEALRLRNATVSLLRLLGTAQKPPSHSTKCPTPSSVLNTSDISVQSTFFWPTLKALRASATAEKSAQVRSLFSLISPEDEEEFLFSFHNIDDEDDESEVAAYIRQTNDLALKDFMRTLKENDSKRTTKMSSGLFDEPLPKLVPGFALLPHHHLHLHRTRLVRHYRGVHRFYLTKLRAWLDERSVQKAAVIAKLKTKLSLVLSLRKAEARDMEALSGNTLDAQVTHVLDTLEAADTTLGNLRDSMMRSQQFDPVTSAGDDQTETYRALLIHELSEIAVLHRQLKVLSDPKPLFTFKDYASHTPTLPVRSGMVSLDSTMLRRELGGSFGNAGFNGMLTARSVYSGNSGLATPGRIERALANRIPGMYTNRVKVPRHVQPYFHDDHPLDFMLDPYQGCALTVLTTTASYLDDGEDYQIDETGDLAVKDDDNDSDITIPEDDDGSEDASSDDNAVGSRLWVRVERLVHLYSKRTQNSCVGFFEDLDDDAQMDNSMTSLVSGDNNKTAPTRQPSEFGSTSSGTHTPKRAPGRGLSGHTLSCDSRDNGDDGLVCAIQYDPESRLERRIRRYWYCQRHLQRLSVLLLSREILNLVDEVVGIGSEDKAEAGHDWLKYPRGIRPPATEGIHGAHDAPTVELSSCASLLSLFFPPSVVTTTNADTTTIPFSFSPSLELLSTCAHLYSPLYARPNWKLTYFRFLYILFLQQYLSAAFATRPHEILSEAHGEDAETGSDVGVPVNRRGAQSYEAVWRAFFTSQEPEIEAVWHPLVPSADSTALDRNEPLREVIDNLVSVCRDQAVNAYHVRSYLRPLQRSSVARATQSLVSKLLSTLRRMVEVDDESAILTTSDEIETKTADEVQAFVEAQRAARRGRFEQESKRHQTGGKSRKNSRGVVGEKKRKKKIPEWKREAELAVNRAKAAAKRYERTSVRDKAHQLGIVYTLVKEIDLEHTIRELRDQQMRKKQRQRHSFGTSAGGSPKDAPPHGTYKFPVNQELDATAASSSVGGETAPLYDNGRRPSYQFGESAVFGATAATATTAAFGRTGMTGTMGTDRKMPGSECVTPLPSHREESPPAWGFTDTPTLVARQASNTFDHDAPPNGLTTLPPRVAPPIISGGVPKLALSLAPPPLYYTSSGDTAAATDAQMPAEGDGVKSPVEGDESEIETKSVKTEFTEGGVNSPHRSVFMGVPKLALSLAPPPLYYTSTGDTAAATDSQIPVEEMRAHEKDELPPPKPTVALPKMGVPKLALSLAPPPLYYTSSGDTAAATDSQIPVEEMRYHEKDELPPPKSVHVSPPKMGVPKLALSLAPPPLYYTSSGDTAAATDSQIPVEEMRAHEKDELPPPKPTVALPKMGVPKLALSLAPPPLYYTSSGDTAAATDSQIPVEEMRYHEKDELPPPPQQKQTKAPKMGVPKLALSLAPPPLYYTSSGDTAAAADAQMPMGESPSSISNSATPASPSIPPLRTSVPALNLGKRLAESQGGSGPVSQRAGKGGLNTGRRPPDTSRSVGWDDTMNTVVKIDPSSPPINSPKPVHQSPSGDGFGGNTPVSPASSGADLMMRGGGPAVPPLPISILKRDSATGGATSGSARGAGYFSQRGDVSARSGNSTSRRKITKLEKETDSGASTSATTPALPFKPQMMLPLRKLGELGSAKNETPPSTTDLSPRLGHSAKSAASQGDLSADVDAAAGSGIHAGFQAFVHNDMRDRHHASPATLYPILGPSFLKTSFVADQANSSYQGDGGGPRSVSLLASPAFQSERVSRRLPPSSPSSFAFSRGFAALDQSSTFSQNVSPRARSLRSRGLSLRRNSTDSNFLFGDPSSPLSGFNRSRGSVFADTQLYPMQLLLNPPALLEHQRAASRNVYANGETHAELLSLLLTLLVRGVNGVAAAAQAASELPPSIPDPPTEAAINDIADKVVAESGVPSLSKAMLKALRPTLPAVLPSLCDALALQDAHKRSKRDRNVLKIKKLVQRNSTMGTLDGRYVAAYAMMAGAAESSQTARGGKSGDALLSSRSTTGGAGLGQSRVSGQNILFPIHRHIAHPLNKEVVALLGRKFQQECLNPGLDVLIRLLVGPDESRALESSRRRSISHFDDAALGSPAVSFHSPQLLNQSSVSPRFERVDAVNSVQANAALLTAYVKQQVQQAAKLNFGPAAAEGGRPSTDVLQRLLLPKPSSGLLANSPRPTSDGSPFDCTQNIAFSNTLSDTLSGTTNALMSHVVEVLRGAALSSTMAGELFSEGLRSTNDGNQSPGAKDVGGSPNAGSLPDFHPKRPGFHPPYQRPASSSLNAKPAATGNGSSLVQNMIAGLYVGLNSSSSSSNAFRQRRVGQSPSQDQIDVVGPSGLSPHGNSQEEARLWDAIRTAADDPPLEARKIGAGAFGTVIASQLGTVNPSLLLFPSQSPSQFFELVGQTIEASLAPSSRKPNRGRQLRFFLCEDDDPEYNVVVPRGSAEKMYDFKVLSTLIYQCRSTLAELEKLVPGDKDDADDAFTQEEVDVQANQVKAVLARLIEARRVLVDGADNVNDANGASAFGFGGLRVVSSSVGLPLAIKLISLPSHPDDRNAIFGLHAEVLAMIRFMKSANNTDSNAKGNMSRASLLEGPNAASQLTTNHACEVLDFGCTKTHLYAVMPRYPLTAKQWRERIDPENQRSRLKVLEPEAGCESEEEVSEEDDEFNFDSDDSDETPDEHRARVKRRKQIRRRVRRLEAVFEAQEATRTEETRKALLHLATEQQASAHQLTTPSSSQSPSRQETESSPNGKAGVNKDATTASLGTDPCIDVRKVPNATMITMFPVLATMFLQMLDSIIALHEECSVVHYDIKCDNYFLDFDPLDRAEANHSGQDKTVTVRLGDFGECYFNSHASAKRSTLQGTKAAAGKRGKASAGGGGGETLRQLLLSTTGKHGSVRFAADVVAAGSSSNKTSLDLAFETLHALAADEEGESSDSVDDTHQNVQRGGRAVHDSDDEEVGSGEKYESLEDDEGSTTPVSGRRRHGSDSETISLSSDDERDGDSEAFSEDDGSTLMSSNMSDDFGVAEMHANTLFSTTGWQAQQNQRERIEAVGGRTAHLVDLMQVGTSSNPASPNRPQKRVSARTPRSARISSRGSDEDLALTATSKRIAEINIQRDEQFNNPNISRDDGSELGRGMRPLELAKASPPLQRSGSSVGLNSARQIHSARSNRGDRVTSATGFRRPIGTTPTTAALLSSRGRSPALGNSSLQLSYLQQLSARSTNNAVTAGGRGHSRQQQKQQQSSKLDERYARGTEAIRPPELLLPHKYLSDRRRRAHRTGYESDVWACGCLLFELLTGDFLFREEHFAKLLHRVTKERDGELLEEKHREMLNNDADVITFLKFTLCRDPQRRPLLSEVRKRFLGLTRKKLSMGGWKETLEPYLTTKPTTGLLAHRIPVNRPSQASAALKLYDVVRDSKGVASSALPSLRRNNLLPIECHQTRLDAAVKSAAKLHNPAENSAGALVASPSTAQESIQALTPEQFISGFIPITHNWLSKWLAGTVVPMYQRTRLWRLSLAAARSSPQFTLQNRAVSEKGAVDASAAKWLCDHILPQLQPAVVVSAPPKKPMPSPQLASVLEAIVGSCVPVLDDPAAKQLMAMITRSLTSVKPTPAIQAIHFAFSVVAAAPPSTVPSSSPGLLEAFMARTSTAPTQEEATARLLPHHGIRLLAGAAAVAQQAPSTGGIETPSEDLDTEDMEAQLLSRLSELDAWAEYRLGNKKKRKQPIPLESSATTNAALRWVAADDLQNDQDEAVSAVSMLHPFEGSSNSRGAAPPTVTALSNQQFGSHHHSHPTPFVHLSPYLSLYVQPFYSYYNHVISGDDSPIELADSVEREKAICRVAAQVTDAAAIESELLKNELFKRQLQMAQVECIDSVPNPTPRSFDRPNTILGVPVSSVPKGVTVLTPADEGPLKVACSNAAANDEVGANAASQLFNHLNLPNVAVESEATLEAFLGGLYAPLHLTSLQEMGFTHVLNFAPVSPAEATAVASHFHYLDMCSCFHGATSTPHARSSHHHEQRSPSGAHSPLSSATPSSQGSESRDEEEERNGLVEDWDRCSDHQLQSKPSFEIPKADFITDEAQLTSIRQYHRQFAHFFTKGGAVERFCAGARASGGRVLIIPAPPIDGDAAAAIRAHHTERLKRQVSAVGVLREAITALTTAKRRVEEERWVGGILQRIISVLSTPTHGSNTSVFVPLGTATISAVEGPVQKNPSAAKEKAVSEHLGVLFAPLYQALLDNTIEGSSPAASPKKAAIDGASARSSLLMDTHSTCHVRDANPTLSWLLLNMISRRLSEQTAAADGFEPSLSPPPRRRDIDPMATISSALGDTLVSESTSSDSDEIGWEEGDHTITNSADATLAAIRAVLPSIIGEVQQVLPTVVWDLMGVAPQNAGSRRASHSNRASFSRSQQDVSDGSYLAEIRQASDAVIELLTNTVVLRQASRASSPAARTPSTDRATIMAIPSSKYVSTVVHGLCIPTHTKDHPSLLLQCEMLLRGYFATQHGCGSRTVLEQTMSVGSLGSPHVLPASPTSHNPLVHALLRGLALDQHTLSTARTLAASFAETEAHFTQPLPASTAEPASNATVLTSPLASAVNVAMTLASISLERDVERPSQTEE